MRVTMWSSLKLGMHMNAKVYRTFCVSLFAFIWQLEDIPPSILQEEEWALRQLAPGPGNWVRPVELHNLETAYFHPFSFPSFKNLALACKLRVLSYEPMLNIECLPSGVFGHDKWC